MGRPEEQEKEMHCLPNDGFTTVLLVAPHAFTTIIQVCCLVAWQE